MEKIKMERERDREQTMEVETYQIDVAMNVINEFQPFKKNEYLNLNCLFTMGDISVCKFNVVKLVVTNTT